MVKTKTIKTIKKKLEKLASFSNFFTKYVDCSGTRL